MKRPSANITAAERRGRIVLGLAAVVVGLVLLMSVSGADGVVLEVLLVAAGLDMFVTGALGHCPLYAKLSRATMGAGRPVSTTTCTHRQSRTDRVAVVTG